MATHKAVEEKMQEVIESISATEKVIASEIQTAAHGGDWNTVSTLTITAKKLTQVKDDLSTELSKFVSSAAKKFVVTVTAGALANDYLSASSGMKANLLQAGQKVTLVFGKKEVSTTVLKFGRFQDRKNVARFYGEHNIAAGDSLQLSMDVAGKWHVHKI